MADSSIDVTPGTGATIDTRTETTNSNHRQVVVVGDPATNAGVAPVDATKGLGVNMVSGAVASGAIASGAIASGAVASGAFASGSIASGAIASGAIAAGAIAAGATSIADNEDVASADGDRGVKMLVVRKDTPAATSGTDGDYEFLQVSGGLLWVRPIQKPFNISVDVTRPANTTAYTAADAISDSTTAPTSGGFTFSSVARVSGGSGLITDLKVASSNNAGGLAGECLIFNTSVTNVDDNAAFVISDSEVKTLVAKIPFYLEGIGNNSFYHATRLNIVALCSGSANLRFLLRVRSAYTPISSEVFSLTLSGMQLD